MRNEDAWRPTKFVRVNGRYRASRDPKHVAPGSRLITDRLALAYEQALLAHARGALLDLGCGQVPLYAIYQPLTTEVVCIDWAERGAVAHLDYAADLNQPIPLSDARFDTVLATDVLEHIARPAHLFGEITRLLREGGKLIAGVPFLYWIHEEPHDYYRYTEFALQKLCEDNGLVALETEPYGGGPEVAIDTLLKLSAHGRFGASLLGRWATEGISVVAQVALRTRLVRRLSRATARTLPLGYCLVATKRGHAHHG